MAEPEEVDLRLDPEPEPDQQYIESDDDFICFDTDKIIHNDNQADPNQNRPE